MSPEETQTRGKVTAVLRDERPLDLLLMNGTVAGLYWLAAVLVRWYFSRYAMWPAPIWLPAGVAMYAVFARGRWAAPGILLGSLLTNLLSFHGSPLSAIAVAIGNTLGPLITVAWIRKRGVQAEPFSRVSYVFLFALGCIANGAISASFGSSTISLAASDGLNQWSVRWIDWMISDCGASLLLVPLFLLLERDPLALRRVARDRLEAFLIAVISAGTVAYFLSRSTGLLAVDAGSSFLILLPVLWAAVRFSARFAYPLFVLVMTLLMVATLAGRGPYAEIEKGGKFFIFAQMSFALGICVLLLGAVSEQQRNAEKALRKLNQDLESLVKERTAELQESKRQLERVAFHDVLTGLPNRRFFEDRFAAAKALADRNRSRIAVLLIDLDHFKRINDTLGHDAGDALLMAVGERLSKSVREYDVVARLGGDEFAVLLIDTSNRSQVDFVCSRIVEGLKDPVFVNGKDVGTSPSVGVAVYPVDGANWHEIYKAADLALYAAKQNGRGRWHFYESLESSAQARVDADIPVREVPS